jgi:hypothetical protein
VAFRPNKLEIFSFGDKYLEKYWTFPHNSFRPSGYIQTESVDINDTLLIGWPYIVKQIILRYIYLGTETYRQFLPPPDFVEVPPDLPTISNMFRIIQIYT